MALSDLELATWGEFGQVSPGIGLVLLGEREGVVHGGKQTGLILKA